MIQLRDDTLTFSFPDIHPGARLDISFQRTLRIPDDDRDWPLPPGIGHFPLRKVDDFAERAPKPWLAHGGVMLPMYQAEAMWLSFDPAYVSGHETRYPFAIQIAAGKVNAASGEAWSDKLVAEPQSYLVAPQQPWLDGFCVEKGIIRQFVAMPLGAGYSAEEQLTGRAETGGLQILVRPMQRAEFERRFPKARRRRSVPEPNMICCAPACMPDMGLGAGGRMRQSIETDPFGIDAWDTARSRCFVHLANALVWNAITGEQPPHPAPTAATYTRSGLPWFDWYDERSRPIDGATRLALLKTIRQLGAEKGDMPLPENEAVMPEDIIALRRALPPGYVREANW